MVGGLMAVQVFHFESDRREDTGARLVESSAPPSASLQQFTFCIGNSLTHLQAKDKL